MRRLVLALAVSMLACGPANPAEHLAMVEDTVRDEFALDGVVVPPNDWIVVLEYEQPCLPNPWNIDIDPETDEITVSDFRCRTGRTLYFYFACVVAIRHYRADPYWVTSFPHELMHCGDLDPWHGDRPHWDVTVPRAVQRLREMDL